MDDRLKHPNIDGRTTYQEQMESLSGPLGHPRLSVTSCEKTGARDVFFCNQGHIHYVVKAIRDARDAPSKFLGRNPKKYAPKVGDLINAGRGTAKK